MDCEFPPDLGWRGWSRTLPQAEGQEEEMAPLSLVPLPSAFGLTPVSRLSKAGGEAEPREGFRIGLHFLVGIGAEGPRLRHQIVFFFFQSEERCFSVSPNFNFCCSQHSR